MPSNFDPRDYGFDAESGDSRKRRSSGNRQTQPHGLPDPELHAGFYEDVSKKRLGAWIVDTLIVGILTGLVVIFTAFLATLIAPFIFLIIGFIYRTMSISRHSATPGMRLMGIELRNSDGDRLDGSMAFMHTLGYTLSFGTFIIQIVSMGIMLTGNSGKGLSDMVLGTAMINSVSQS